MMRSLTLTFTCFAKMVDRKLVHRSFVINFHVSQLIRMLFDSRQSQCHHLIALSWILPRYLEIYILTGSEKLFVPSEGFSPLGYSMEIVITFKLRQVRIRISSRTSLSLSLIMSFDVTFDKVGKLFCDQSFYCGTVYHDQVP